MLRTLLTLLPFCCVAVETAWVADLDDWQTSGGATLDRTAEGLRLTLPASDRARTYRLQLATSPVLSAPQRVSVRCHGDDDGISIAPVLRERGGEILTYPRAAEGTWDLTASPAASRGRNANGHLDGEAALIALVIESEPHATTRVVDLADLSVLCAAPPAAFIDLRIDTGNPWQVLATDAADGQAAAILRNPTRSPLHLEAVIEVVDHRHRATPVHSGPITLAPGEERRWDLVSAIGDRRGWFRVVCRTGDQQRASRSVVRMLPARSRPGHEDGFKFALCAKIAGVDDERERFSLGLVQLAGIEVVREQLEWHVVQPSPRGFAKEVLAGWRADVDRAWEAGVEMQVILCYNTPWSAPAETRGDPSVWQFLPPDPAAFTAYVEQALQAVGHRVRWWEVWNEPDIIQFWNGSYEEYAALLRATHATIKAHDPAHQVLTGGFALVGGHGGKRDPQFQEKVVDQCQDAFDVLAHHQHGPFRWFRDHVDGGLMPMVRRLGPGKTLWFNETAVHRREFPDDPHWGQATCLAKKLSFAWARGAIGFTWFQDLRGELDSLVESSWGLYTADRQPCAVYAAYNTLIRHLRDRTYAGDLGHGRERYAYAFANAQDRVVVLWDEADDCPQRLLAVAGSGVTRTDLMDNPQPLREHAGWTWLATPRDPELLRLPGATGAVPEVVADLICADPWLVPGRASALTLILRNPTTGAITYDLTADPAISDLPATINLAPGERREIAARVILPETAVVPHHRLVELPLQLGGAGAPWQGDLHLRRFVAVRAGSGERAPDLVVDREHQVRNRFRYVPQTDHLTWQGPADLSYAVWFAADAQALDLRVVVRDDQHRPSPDASRPESGDAVECTLALPGQNGVWTIVVHPAAGAATALVRRSPRGQPATALIPTVSADIGTGEVVYHLRLPLAGLDTTRETLATGLGFNIAVYDLDVGDQREGWIQAAPDLVHWETTSRSDVLPRLVLP